jgi:hypothetical protein
VGVPVSKVQPIEDVKRRDFEPGVSSTGLMRRLFLPALAALL